MAQIGGGGGKRSPDVDLNLVPFIDLMSVMITFLLVTAVWSQVAMIKLGSSIYATNPEPEKTPPPKPSVPLRMEVKKMGYKIRLGTPNSKGAPFKEIEIPVLAEGKYDNKGLLARLQQIKLANPAKLDCVMSVEESLKYDLMIRGMDVLLRAGFSQVSVATGGFK